VARSQVSATICHGGGGGSIEPTTQHPAPAAAAAAERRLTIATTWHRTARRTPAGAAPCPLDRSASRSPCPALPGPPSSAADNALRLAGLSTFAAPDRPMPSNGTASMRTCLTDRTDHRANTFRPTYGPPRSVHGSIVTWGHVPPLQLLPHHLISLTAILRPSVLALFNAWT